MREPVKGDIASVGNRGIPRHIVLDCNCKVTSVCKGPKQKGVLRCECPVASAKHNDRACLHAHRLRRHEDCNRDRAASALVVQGELIHRRICPGLNGG